MENRIASSLPTFAFILFFAVVSGLIFCALQPLATASETAAGRFICAARVDCGAPGLPSTHDLPTVQTPIVISKSADGAREKCMSVHTTAYSRLARSFDGASPAALLRESRGCKVVSEAFPAN